MWRAVVLSGTVGAAAALPAQSETSLPVLAAEGTTSGSPRRGLEYHLTNTNTTGEDLAPWVNRGNEIVFGMLSGQEVVEERAVPKLQTWCEDAKRACIVFSDAPHSQAKPWVIRCCLA